MSTDKTRLEIGHVLFIDIVGYSKLLLKPQSELLRELNEIVSGTKEFRGAESAGKLIRLPTGDGMALVFRTNPEAPVESAMEIARALKSHPAIQLRMGIRSGRKNSRRFRNIGVACAGRKWQSHCSCSVRLPPPSCSFCADRCDRH